MACPSTSMRSMMGSSMVRGRSARTSATASLTSFKDRSVSVPSRNSRIVDDMPSVKVEVICLTPVMFATASSMTFVTCVSSSAGAAPDCVTFTETIGTSMFGNRVTGSDLKLKRPSSISTANKTIAGTGRRIDQAEMLIRITEPRSVLVLERWDARHRRREEMSRPA